MKTLQKNMSIGMLIGAGLVAGCVSSQPIVSAQSGAVAANINAQAITPPADQKANTHIPADVTLTDAARDRYHAGKVKEPRPVSTQ